MKNRMRVWGAVIGCGFLFGGVGACVADWQVVSELESVDFWRVGGNSTMVEPLARENGEGHKGIQFLGRAGESGAKAHVIASATSPFFADGGTLFFNLRFPAADASMMNGRICFSSVGLNSANDSCGFRFTVADKAGLAALNPTEPMAKAVWLSPDRWYQVWFSVHSQTRNASVTIRESEGDRQWELKPGIIFPANAEENPFQFFGIVIGGSPTPRPVQLADFRWSPSRTTDLPGGIAP